MALAAPPHPWPAFLKGGGRCRPWAVGRSRRGFTLIELLVVITIIAIILSFVILAATDASRRAEERATQSLITKLEGGLNDRLDALMQSRPDPNWAHGYMATVWNSNYTAAPNFGAAPSLFTTTGSLNSAITDVGAGAGVRLVRLLEA